MRCSIFFGRRFTRCSSGRTGPCFLHLVMHIVYRLSPSLPQLFRPTSYGGPVRFVKFPSCEGFNESLCPEFIIDLAVQQLLDQVVLSSTLTLVKSNKKSSHQWRVDFYSEKLNEGASAVGMERSTSNNSTKNEEICDRCTGIRTSGFCTCVRNGTCSCPPNVAPSPSCVYYSPCIQGLLEGQRTEFETARDHWTEVDPTSEAEAKSLAQDNGKYFDEVLKTHPEWGDFFQRFEDLEIGEKIGEGGQAEIFATVSHSFRVYESSVSLVAKVWKGGISLKNLAQQWPPQMLSRVAKDVSANNHPFNNIYGGTFIRDGEFKNRFAFVMQKY